MTTIPTAAPARPGAGSPLTGVLRELALDEFARAAGIPRQGFRRDALGRLLGRPITSAARLLANFDESIGAEGVAVGFGRLAEPFVSGATFAGLEHLRASGPLLLVSNHPGAYDVMILSSILGRTDLKVMTSTVRMYRAMPHWHASTIEVPDRSPAAGNAAPSGLNPIEESARQLHGGGALLIFPSGVVDPDPDVLPGAREALGDWRTGIERILRAAPETPILHAIVSGVISPRWIRNPLVRRQKVPLEQRKLAEMLQVLQSLLFRKTAKRVPRVTFAPPVTLAGLGVDPSEPLLPPLIARAADLLEAHLALQPDRARHLALRDGRWA